MYVCVYVCVYVHHISMHNLAQRTLIYAIHGLVILHIYTSYIHTHIHTYIHTILCVHVLAEKNLLMLRAKEEEFDSLTSGSGVDLTLSEEYLEYSSHIRDMYTTIDSRSYAGYVCMYVCVCVYTTYQSIYLQVYVCMYVCVRLCYQQ